MGSAIIKPLTSVCLPSIAACGPRPLCPSPPPARHPSALPEPAPRHLLTPSQHQPRGNQVLPTWRPPRESTILRSRTLPTTSPTSPLTPMSLLTPRDGFSSTPLSAVLRV